MPKHTPSIFSSQILHVTGFIALCVVGSFFVGIETAGQVRVSTSIQADEMTSNGIALSDIVESGDIDGSGEVDVRDAILILEFVQGYETPTMLQLKADPNGDNHLTVEDALRVLRSLAIRK